MLATIYDGIQRPLEKLYTLSGKNIERGIEVTALDHQKKWKFSPMVQKGQEVGEGDILGTVQETPAVTCKIMVPYGVNGTIKEIYQGEYTVEETVAIIVDRKNKEHKVTMLQKWPVRRARPYHKKLNPDTMLVTGQRVVDTTSSRMPNPEVSS